MSRGNPPGLRADAVVEAVRADILAGVLEPGQRLTFPALCAAHGVSVGVLREALIRLVSRGIVEAESNLGFRVLSLTAAGLAEHARIRSLIEPLFAAEAVAEGSIEWEADLIAAHHVLERTPVNDGGEHEAAAWTSAHTSFHLALVSAGASPRIREITTRLLDEAVIYRRWSTRSEPLDVGHGRQAAEHRALVDAVLSRDGARAAALLREHIRAAAAELTVEESREPPPSQSRHRRSSLSRGG